MASSSSAANQRRRPLFPILVGLSLLPAAVLTATRGEQEGDRVRFLLGQPSRPPLSQFAGYVTVNEHSGRQGRRQGAGRAWPPYDSQIYIENLNFD